MSTTKNDTRKVIGKIIKVSRDGWGFISSKEIEFTRIFFHWTSLRQDTLGFKELKTGMLVEFTPLQAEGKGFRAMHVRVITKPTRQQTTDLAEVKEESDDTGEKDDDTVPSLHE